MSKLKYANRNFYDLITEMTTTNASRIVELIHLFEAFWAARGFSVEWQEIELGDRERGELRQVVKEAPCLCIISTLPPMELFL